MNAKNPPGFSAQNSPARPNTIRLIVLGLLLVAVCFVFWRHSQGYSLTGGPTTAVVEDAVESALKQHVPARLRQTMLPSRASEIEEITVLEIGSARPQNGETVWVAKMRVKGTAQTNTMGFGGTRVEGFSGVAEWLVHRDSLGRWQARNPEL